MPRPPTAPPRRVLHLSTYAASRGAARAAHRLHSGLRALGWESEMLVLKSTLRDPTVHELALSTSLPARMRRALVRLRVDRQFRGYRAAQYRDFDWFSDDRSPSGWDVARQLPDHAVLQLHWVAGFVDYRMLFGALAPGARVVWRLSDMNPFTGGCHYARDCRRFESDCGACPQLRSADSADLSRAIWRRKREAYAKAGAARIEIVAPTTWIAAEAGRSALLRHCRIRRIPNGLDVHDFSPRDRGFARETLGIAPGAKVVLFVADDTSDRRKGLSSLMESLHALRSTPELTLVSVGSSHVAAPQELRHLHLGRIQNDRLLSLVYSAADVYAIPAVQDNMPATVLESLACGTPVVGFEAGGISDMVRPGITGLLAPPGDSEALAGTLRRLLTDDGVRGEMARECRRVAEREYSVETMARAYHALYEELLDER